MAIIDAFGLRLDQLASQSTFIWEPASATAVWTISHNLGKYPSITVVESTGAVIKGRERYIDANTIEITFLSPLTGKAYLN